MLRALLRATLRWFSRNVPIRGRLKLADKLGAVIAPRKPQVIQLNGLNIELDHGVLTHRMMFYDLYEENIMNFLEHYLRPGMTVFDPGANLGYFAAKCLGMVLPGGKVYSFEPSNTCLGRLRRDNKVDAITGWKLLPMALTDRTGGMTFYDTPRVISRGYACLEGVSTPGDRIAHEVQVTTVDAFCEEHNIQRVHFLKLDIEGSELPALRGAEKMIANGALPVIMVETTLTQADRQTTTQIDELLRSAG
ncbi:MAG: FkbM family methyltransferase, partial [Bacteroidota bacterium]|nr:FkbM family methyltransferase [Bacteroidota bacterium]